MTGAHKRAPAVALLLILGAYSTSCRCRLGGLSVNPCKVLMAAIAITIGVPSYATVADPTQLRFRG